MAASFPASVTQAGIDRRSRRRDQVEQLLALAQYFAPEDRLLVEQVYAHGIPLADVARLSGKPARMLQRRFQRLLKRINQPLFVFVINHQDTFPADLQQAATHLVLHGRSLRQTARLMKTSLYAVRLHVQSLHTLARRAGLTSFTSH